MKGMVFTSLLEMIENEYGYEMVDKIITESGVSSNGVYTSVGTYDFKEMQQLLISFGKNTRQDIDEILHKFGRYFFQVMTSNYAVFFQGHQSALTFLASIDSVIHVEVYKLYPEAQLPKFEIIEHTPERLEMNYSSGRKMASFAFGLIEKTVEFYKEECSIKMKNLTEEGDVVNFIIKKIV